MTQPLPDPAEPPLEVFVPFWGDPGLLYATVDSVKAQTDPRWTMTVVDDCYPDPGVAEHFAAETDPRIRYVRHETNLGITDNYRACQAMASGELMMFLGCDDLMHPDFVATVTRAAREHPQADVVQVGVEVVDGDGQVVLPLGDRVKRALMPKVDAPLELSGEELAVSLLRGNWLYWPSLVFRTAAVQRREFRDDLPIIQDLALLVDMAAAGDTLLVVPDTVFAYRRHMGSASATSLLHGRRLGDERTYYDAAADQMRARGWSRAERVARTRWTSRLHALTLVPSALRDRSVPALRSLARHALSPSRPSTTR